VGGKGGGFSEEHGNRKLPRDGVVKGRCENITHGGFEL